MRFSVRLQAARHSCLLMCVPASQKPMQSCRLLPPPPGVLGAVSLWLALAPGAALGAPPDDGVVSVGAAGKGAPPLAPPDDDDPLAEPPDPVDCCVWPEGEFGAETGGDDSGAIGAT
jgi:hypothetical protein